MSNTAPTTRQSGQQAEDSAIAWLQHQGLVLLQRNFRTPGRGGGEIDLIMRAADGTLVFVEVRHRADASHGGAAASISHGKRRRIILAARHYLMQQRREPPCRFDAMVCDGPLPEQGGSWQWLQAAFDAS